MKTITKLSEYGTVTYEGVEYQLTQHAYCSNSGDGVAYFASAILAIDDMPDYLADKDVEIQTYRVVWVTTAEYDKNDKMCNLALYLQDKASHESLTDEEQEQLAEAETYDGNDDDSNACDWDNPSEVYEF